MRNQPNYILSQNFSWARIFEISGKNPNVYNGESMTFIYVMMA